MNEKKYEVGYDMMGQKIIIDEQNNFITHNPDDLSPREVIEKLEAKESIHYKRQSQKTESIPVEVAPKEMWPLFYAWNQNCLSNTDDIRTFDEFASEFTEANLTTEQEWEIIHYWQNYMASPEAMKISLEEFRKKCLKNIYKTNPEESKGTLRR